MHVNKLNQNKNKTKSRHISITCKFLKKSYILIFQKVVDSSIPRFLTRHKYITSFHCWTSIQANKYLLKFNNRNPRKWCGKCPKLTVKYLELYHWRRSCVFIANFEYISYIIFQYIYFICWDLQIRFLFIKSVLLFFHRPIIRSFSHFKRIVTIKNVFFVYTFNKLWS